MTEPRLPNISLEKYLEQRLVSLELRITEHYQNNQVALEKFHHERVESTQRLDQRLSLSIQELERRIIEKFQARDKAAEKSEEVLNGRLHHLNENRTLIIEERVNFVRNETIYPKLDDLFNRLNKIESDIRQQEAVNMERSRAYDRRLWIVGLLTPITVTVLLAIIGFILRLYKI